MADFHPTPADFLEFRNEKELERVRLLDQDQFLHPASDLLRIRMFPGRDELYSAFADDLVDSLRTCLIEKGQATVIIPAGPMGHYRRASERINQLRLDLSRVHFFAMDEYADSDGVSAPASWPGSFARAVRAAFFDNIDAALRPPEDAVHAPSGENIDHYGEMIAERGGADVCYGGIGWNGHVAFWEPHLGHEFLGDLGGYRRASARLVDLHPITIAQNALHSFDGDWSAVPPRAVTIGPAEILGAERRSFWLDGDLGGGLSWQRFIARLAAHGPVSEFVPGSLLQTAPSELNVVAAVAAPLTVSIN